MGLFGPDPLPRKKKRTSYMIVSLARFQQLLAEKKKELGARWVRRIVEGELLYAATLAGRDASEEEPKGRPYHAYSPRQALKFAQICMGTMLPEGNYTAVPFWIWRREIQARSVACLPEIYTKRRPPSKIDVGDASRQLRLFPERP